MGLPFAAQVGLLLWKRRQELRRQPGEVAKLVVAPCFVFALLVLIYESFNKPIPLFPAAGFLNPYVIPIAFWAIVVKTVIFVMNEKQLGLREAAKLMGMRESAYYTSIFISEGLVHGLAVSLLCSLFTLYHPCPPASSSPTLASCNPSATLFNQASVGSTFGLYFCFCLAAVPFSLFLCCFFSAANSAGQAMLAVLIVLYVVFCAKIIDSTSVPLLSWCCVLPPLALQVGALSLIQPADPPSTSSLPTIASVDGILLADVVLYSVLAWYFSASRPWDFWRSGRGREGGGEKGEEKNPLATSLLLPEDHAADDDDSREQVDLVGGNQPTVKVTGLSKSFGNAGGGGARVVDNVSFEMYQDQIYCLLGHNGAGKTTTISILTGSLSPTSVEGFHVYGHGLDDLTGIRSSLGVCPQHDVLFENLSVAEHIVFFSRLKGYTWHAAAQEADYFLRLFHLGKRARHKGAELSGGQRRKLSVAIAVCGGSKLVCLDEPSAGMDPLARRELWDLLSSLRVGRTILLTSHYMDECEVLGDRIAIMNLGRVVCEGSCLFLKKRYGSGYRLTFQDKAQVGNLFFQIVRRHVASAEMEPDSDDTMLLPFSCSPAAFASLFSELESLGGGGGGGGVGGFGLSITSLEQVYLKVGCDASVAPNPRLYNSVGEQRFAFSLTRQIVGIARRRLAYAANDLVTIPLLLLPIGGTVACAVLYSLKLIENEVLQAFALSAIYCGTYIGVPGLIAEYLVREKESRLRNLLTVCGTDFRAYHIGNLIGDATLLAVPLVAVYVSWAAAGMSGFITSPSNAAGGFFVFFIFLFELVGFSYLASSMFTSPRAAASFMPLVVLGLLMLPLICVMLGVYLFVTLLHVVDAISASDLIGSLLWGVSLCSPHGALLVSLMDVSADFGSLITGFPSYQAVVTVMLVEGCLFFFAAYFIDKAAVAPRRAVHDDYSTPLLQQRRLDDDVAREREETLAAAGMDPRENESPFPSSTTPSLPLLVARLRKVFPAKSKKAKPVVAAQDVSFRVQQGEIFGLLGANGAGKTTTVSMITRHLLPTAGTAFVKGVSVLEAFPQAATNLGVVTQNNSLWDLLSVEDHLYLFCRLRGVPEAIVGDTVDATIDQLELTPHRHKLACRLSGGMKRKLCVAVALIGDPACVLLDEPSAGLDPKSRRNLWSVILRTMARRSVVLTSHSMEEVEALCTKIGIMVNGQLHALGTKQHLKCKFGGGYEVAVRLVGAGAGSATERLRQQVERLSDFMRNLSPGAQLLNSNATLATFRIPRDECRIGRLFADLSEQAESLGVADFAVNQPTLEQVFIKVVTADRRQRAAPSGTLKDAVLTIEDEQDGDGDGDGDGGGLAGTGGDEAPNCCGCLPRQLLYSAYTALAVFIAFFMVSFAGRGSPDTRFAGPLAVVCLVACWVLCCCARCPCCRNPDRGLDE